MCIMRILLKFVHNWLEINCALIFRQPVPVECSGSTFDSNPGFGGKMASHDSLCTRRRWGCAEAEDKVNIFRNKFRAQWGSLDTLVGIQKPDIQISETFDNQTLLTYDLWMVDDTTLFFTIGKSDILVQFSNSLDLLKNTFFCLDKKWSRQVLWTYPSR